MRHTSGGQRPNFQQEEPEMTPVVDQDTCIGCGLCCAICDAVFHIGDEGKSVVRSEGSQADQARIQEAIDSCPVSAIRWEE